MIAPMDDSPPDPPDTQDSGPSALGLDLPESSKPETGAGYRVLARKYRPQTFGELIGQDALVRTLTNAIATGRIANAYMLTGIRGVGKTTTARLIARALNCIGPDGTGGPTISPCGVCEHCKAIAADRHVDVLEMDAASRTGVDDVREIIEGVRYAPATARYKVYIIDEVHMLSRNAFNALLKTLEEPPPHARFIFATTEIRKVPVTVLSRAQRFDLMRMTADLVAKHLLDVAGKEQVALDETAAAMLARAADGSMRDGLSLLDQAIALGDGAVTQAVVADMLGLADREAMVDLFEMLVSGKTPDALALAEKMAAAGAEPLIVTQDLLEFTHFVTRCRFSEKAASDPGLPEADRVRAPELAKKLSIPVLTRLWQMLLAGIEEVSRAPDPAAALDMLIIRIVHAAGQPTPGELLKALRGGQEGAGQGTSQSHPAGSEPAPKAEPVASLAPAPLAPAPTAPEPTAPEPVASEPPNWPEPPQELAEVQAAEPEITEPNAQTERFSGLLDSFSDRLDPEMMSHLRRDIRILSCGDRKLEIAVNERAPTGLSSQLNDELAAATGERWVVAVVERPGGQSVVDYLAARDAAIRAEVAGHPLVKDILQTFEGARLEVRETADKAESSPEPEQSESPEPSERSGAPEPPAAAAPPEPPPPSEEDRDNGAATGY